MDFIIYLPISVGYYLVFTIIARFFKYVTFVLCKAICTALDLAGIIYDQIVYNFGMPQKIVSNRDSRFLSQSW